MNDKIILVIGPGSLIGSRFIETLAGWKIYGAGGETDKSVGDHLAGFVQLDITNPEQVRQVVKKSPSIVVINFAGATDVDGIQRDKPPDIRDKRRLEGNLAYKINVLGTRNIIKACQSLKKFPIFISTGFVFDGKNGPYREEDEIASNPDSVSFYAWTKILAEREVITSEIDYLMLRIDYPYRREYAGKLDFGRSFLKLYDDFKNEQKNIYPIFADQILAPTLIDNIAPAVKCLLEKNATGIFHLTSPELTTPYEFCCELLKVARGVKNPEELIKKGSIEEFQKTHPQIAKRPIKGGLKSDKIRKSGFIPTGWREGVKRAYGKN